MSQILSQTDSSHTVAIVVEASLHPPLTYYWNTHSYYTRHHVDGLYAILFHVIRLVS